MTPLLVLLFGMHPAGAVGTDLLYASATKSVGTLVHDLNHTVNWRIVGRLAAGSLPGTAITLLLLSQFDLNTRGASTAISAVLGFMLLLTAASLVFRRQFVALVGKHMEELTQRQVLAYTVLIGLLLGLLVTVTSVGAGALGVTALLLLYPRLSM